MYTRHFSVPKNYNGIRFSNSTDDGIPVKEHRPKYDSGIKSSHSPLYKPENTDTPTDKSPVSADSESPADENEPIKNEEVLEDIAEDDTLPLSTNSKDNDATASSTESKHFNLPIRELLNGINREDALLICLILLIAAENDKDNNSILTMLSLLLLKK